MTGSVSGLCTLIDTFNRVLINPLLLLLFSAGLLVFIYGIVEYIWGLAQETEGKERGKQHMLWGLIGMFVMTCSWAIIKLIASTVGVSLTCTL